MTESESRPSFMRSLCMGYIEEDMLIPFPATSAEQRETLHGVVEALGAMLGSHEADFHTWDRAGEMPTGYIDELKNFGLFGLVVPEEQGGLGFGSAAYSRALQEVARHDASPRSRSARPADPLSAGCPTGGTSCVASFPRGVGPRPRSRARRGLLP